MKRPGLAGLAAIGVGGLVLIAVAVVVRSSNVDDDQARIEEIARQGEAAHDALCALRDDRARDGDRARDALDRDREGPVDFEGLIVPRPLVVRSAVDAEDTVDTLDTFLNCPPPTKKGAAP